MAEAIIHSSRGEKRVEKIADKKASQSEDDILQLNEEEALLFDKPKQSKAKFRSQSKSSKPSKPAALGKAPSSPTPASTGALSTSRASSSTSSDTQTEILNILQIIRSEQKKINSRVVDTNKRINALYSEYDEEEYDENQNYDIDYYDDTGDEVPNHDNTSTADSVSVEPPKKKAEIRCD